MKLKILPLSLFLYKSHFFNSFVPILAFINDKKASNIDLAGNVWFGQNSNIQVNIHEVHVQLVIVLARNSLLLAEGGVYHFQPMPL